MSSKAPNPLEPGRDAVSIEFDPDGYLITTWSDGVRTSTTVNVDFADLVRTKGFATHTFLKAQLRRFPVRRV
ncbi:hypothetical protein [Mycolicibacterium gilvum]|uniref:hypothetical protein n=1 Tax=Mycolicibacterium gilvum TaxID=1804 RepID=UPI004045CE89